MKSEERVEKIERRVKTVEEAIVLLPSPANSGAEGMEKFLFSLEELRARSAEFSAGLEELRAGQRDTQEKINMLIDAQMRTEDRITELSAAVGLAR